MDKRVIFAVAGSGKTTSLVDSLSLDRRFLIVTFTDNNLLNLKRKVAEKFGFMPRNIRLYTYFTFLHSFCYRPLLARAMRTKGITWNPLPTIRFNDRQDAYYLNSARRIYGSRLAKLLETKGAIPEVRDRIAKYSDVLCVDEVQDFAGHDFDFLSSIVASPVEVNLVGDFFQHTFDTSRDGAVNGTLHNDYQKYRKRFTDIGLEIDDTTLVKSHRCAPAICKFIREEVGIDIDSHSGMVCQVELIEEQARVDTLFADARIVKLFFKEHHKYDCYSANWGGSKGQDHYLDVCVVLNPTTMKAFKKKTLKELAPMTRNKFYVACSRARGNLYFISEELIKKHKLQ